MTNLKVAGNVSINFASAVSASSHFSIQNLKSPDPRIPYTVIGVIDPQVHIRIPPMFSWW